MTDEALETQPGGAAAEQALEAPPVVDAVAEPAPDEPGATRETLTAELASCQDRLLRTAAEFDNYRKRTERERREQAERSVESLLVDVLGIVDDFDRALGADAAGPADPYRQGVELIHRRLMEVLGRRGVTPIDALGADFDPNLHQAVTTEPAGDRRDGEVVEEFRRGYMIGERLLRPAMVKVARS